MLRQFAAGSFLLTAVMMLATAYADDAATPEDGKKKEFSQKCPVSGAKAKEDQTAEYKKGKVYFCCKNCKAAFTKGIKKDSLSAKHAVNANAQLVSTGQYIQTKCPFTGGPMKTESEIAGVKVKFCCGNCKKKADTSDDAGLAKVFSDVGFKKGFEKKKEKKDEDKA